MSRISCKNCDSKNDYLEFQELKDLPDFTKRMLLVGKCRKCQEVIATLIEIRKSDKKEFVDSYFGPEAIRVVKREKKRTKAKKTNGNKFQGFVYGINVEIKNKKGEITKVRQYAADYSTNKRNLVKSIIAN